MNPARILVVATFLAAIAESVPAAAQDEAAAAVLFERGLAEMNAGRYETGCPTIAESQRLDPRAGTLFTLAECEARSGRIASAVAHYDDYLGLFAQMPEAQQAKQGARPKIAETQKATLTPDIPELALDLPADAPSGTIVKRDGTRLTWASLGIFLPVDPVPHMITVQLPGGPETAVQVTLEKREKKRLVLKVAPVLASAPLPPLRPGPEAALPPPLPPPPELDRRSTALMVVGIVFTPLATLESLISGLALYVTCAQKTGCDVGSGVAFGVGILTFAGSITAMVVGGQRVPVQPAAASAWVPAVGIGPRSGTLRWTF